MDATLAEVLDISARSALARVHTAIPARVVGVNLAANTVDAEIVVEAAYFDQEGEREYEKRPVVPSVPVQWPRAGGFVFTLPIAVGDYVLLVFCEQSLAEWRTTGQVSQPKDSRRHSIGYPYALPGAFPDVMPLSPIDLTERQGGAAIVGKDGGTAQMLIKDSGFRFGKTAVAPVALAPNVAAFMTAVAAWIALASPRLAAMPVPLTDPEKAALNAAAGVVNTAGGPSAVAAVPSTLVKAL